MSAECGEGREVRPAGRDDGKEVRGAVVAVVVVRGGWEMRGVVVVEALERTEIRSGVLAGVTFSMMRKAGSKRQVVGEV